MELPIAKNKWCFNIPGWIKILFNPWYDRGLLVNPNKKGRLPQNSICIKEQTVGMDLNAIWSHKHSSNTIEIYGHDPSWTPVENMHCACWWYCCFFSKDFKTHYETLEETLTRLEKHKVRINISKVHLCKPKFMLLGYMASKESIEANSAKVEAIANYTTPINHKELQTFLGVVSWC